MPWHENSTTYYFVEFINILGLNYILVLSLTIPIFYFCTQSKHKLLVTKLLISFLSFIIFLSIPAVKIYWYLAPGIPLIIIAMGIIISELVTCTSNYLSTNIRFLLLSIFLGYNSYCIYLYINKNTSNYHLEEQEGGFFHKYGIQNLPIKLSVFSSFPDDTSQFNKVNHHLDVLYFYKTFLKMKNKEMDIIFDSTCIKPKDFILISAQNTRLEYFPKLIPVDTIAKNEFGSILQVK